MKNYHILMADIIGSGKKDSKTVIKGFLQLVNKINNEYKQSFFSPLTVTLGDEFQAVVRSLPDGVKVVLAMEEAVIKLKLNFKLRYVLNFGPIDTKINSDIAYGMLGEGLTSSRKLLGKIKPKKNRFLIQTCDMSLSKKLILAFILYQAIVDAWTFKEYRIVKEFLACDDYKKVASQIKKNVSQSWKWRRSLQIAEYQAVRELISLLMEDAVCET
jgi:hypothetical protein